MENPSVNDLDLIQVQTVLRHGLRAPLSISPYTSTLAWQCQQERDHNLIAYKNNKVYDHHAEANRSM